MPRPEQTGYIVVSIAAGDDDCPTRDPDEVARDIIDAGIDAVVEVRCAYDDGYGHLIQYGGAWVA